MKVWHLLMAIAASLATASSGASIRDVTLNVATLASRQASSVQAAKLSSSDAAATKTDTSSSSSSSSPSSDTTSLESDSVRSLDEYGHAVQLQHAQAAAMKQGRSVLALRRREKDGVSAGATYIIYAHNNDNDNDDSATSRYRRHNHDSLIHMISRSPSQAVVCSGLQADARSLVEALRSHSVSVWERYDDYSSHGNADDENKSNAALHVSYSTGLAATVSQLCQRFWGWSSGESNDSSFWQGACYSQLEQEEWARPMGVQTLVLRRAKCLQLVEPSGVVRNVWRNVCWMGKQSQTNQRNVKLQKALEELMMEHNDSGNESDNDVLKRACQLLAQNEAFGASCRSVVVEQFDASSGSIRKQVLSLLPLSNKT